MLFHGKPRKYLVLLKKNRTDLPKGKLEKGESDKQAAVREVQEETGLRNVRVIKGFKKTRRYTYSRGGKEIKKTVTFFLGSAPRRKIILSKEHKGYLWLTPNEAKKQLKFRNYRSLITAAEKHLK